MRTYFQNLRTQLKSATASMISVSASFWIKLENPGEVNICHDSHNFRFVVKIVRFEWYMQDCLEFFSRVLRDSTSRYVGPSVGPSVGWSVGPLFTFSAFLRSLSIRLLPRCPGDLLQHCSCPPARD